ncbi:MAG: hypothetical protein QW228_00915 [Candidatus Aenigmatarchaeota archaeon]
MKDEEFEKILNCAIMYYTLKNLDMEIEAQCWIWKNPYGYFRFKRIPIVHCGVCNERYRSRSIFIDLNKYLADGKRKLSETTCKELRSLIRDKPRFNINVRWWNESGTIAYFFVSPDRCQLIKFEEGDFKDLNILSRIYIAKKFRSKKLRCITKDGKCVYSLVHDCTLKEWLEKNERFLMKRFNKELKEV